MHAKIIVAVILAAGYSSRMDSFKPLIKLGDKTIIERAVSLFFDAKIKDVFVVAGNQWERIDDALKNTKARIVLNGDYDKGMFSSVLAGLKKLDSNTDAVIILPVDVPLISTETIENLISSCIDNPDKIIIPSFDGQRGHPVIIPAKYFDAIKKWDGKEGLRGALHQFDDDKIFVTVHDRNVLFDIDTPADYKELIKRWTASMG
jgi:molybdenum cofactor cytidylyltransferase